MKHDAADMSLPQPDARQQAVSDRLVQKIRESIAASNGYISFADFMQMVLYEPGLGYYSSGQRKFGRQGDFITAPEVSPLFSQCLARFCHQALATLENGCILEVGAGSGVMAADILQTLEQLAALPQQYLILELSADLQQRQQQTLEQRAPHLLDRVQWLQQLPDTPFRGVVLANELLDAIPVERFFIDAGQVKQWCVGWSDQMQAFSTALVDAPASLQQQVRHIEQYIGEPFADGYESEVSLTHGPWLQSIADCLEQGVMLLVDYGYGRKEYYHPQRSTGTLMCHYRHRAHPDPFVYAGLQDITAYVDFTTIAEAAVANALDVLGYTSQAGFLIGCGIEQLAPADSATDSERLAFAQQVKTLTLPGEMGERFKVMAIGKQITAPVCGFDIMDQMRHL